MPVDPARLSTHHQSVDAYGLRNLIRVLTRRRKWIVGSVVVCVVVAYIMTLTTKPIYDATATIELNKSSAGSLDLGLADLGGQQGGAGGDLAVDMQTEIAILKGDSLALAVIQKLRLAPRPQPGAKGVKDPEQGLPLDDAPQTRARMLGGFKGNLIVKPVRGTRLIEVTYESPDPKRAALIANALIESYKSQYLQSHYVATPEASDWLTKQLSDLKANVEDSEKRLTDFEKESGILSLQTGESGTGGGGGEIHSVVIQKLDALNSELTQAEANSIEKEAIYRLTQAGNDDAILALGNNPLAVQSNSMVLTQGGGTSNLQQLQQKQNELKLSLAEAATTYGANNHRLKEIQI
jgi:uncharacterized protein involved in exopolysaccharide biosynthesis